jgi:hypothetical protein
VALDEAGPAVSILGSAETTGDEGDVIFTSPTSRKRPPKAPRDDFVVEDDQAEYYSSEEVVVAPTKSKGRTQRKRRDGFVVDDDSVEYVSSTDDLVPAPKQQKPSRSQPSPWKERRRLAELEEDLENLADSDNVPKKSRTRGAPVIKRVKRQGDIWKS